MATITQEAKALRRLKLKRDEAKKKADELDAEFKKLQAALIERMDADECESLKVDGTLFVPASTPYGSVQDRSEFVAWAQENDDSLIEPKERATLLNQLVRERLDNGEELPPGIGFYVREYISLRAS